MRLPVVLLVVILFIGSCQQSQNSAQQFNSPQALTESLPKVKPEQITEFNSVDTLYLQHLAYESMALNDGSFVLGDRAGNMILHLNSEGGLIKQMARKGHGPGEVQDILSMSRRPNGGILVYDQRNRKTLLFNMDMKFETEFTNKSFDSGVLTNIYDLGELNRYVVEFNSLAFYRDMDAENELIFANFDKNTNAYSKPRKLKAWQYARNIIDGQAVGATAVPYSPRHLIQYNFAEQTFYTLWTASKKIAKLDATFDTLDTVQINLPQQEITQNEIDSLAEEYDDNQWKTVKKALPAKKTSIENMRIEQGRFWLKLSYRSDVDQWLIVDSNGTPQKIVQFPKGTMLTHVSEHHLGVRMGPGTFALYEPVE